MVSSLFQTLTAQRKIKVSSSFSQTKGLKKFQSGNSHRVAPFPGTGRCFSFLWVFIIKFAYNARCHWLKERAL